MSPRTAWAELLNGLGGPLGIQLLHHYPRKPAFHIFHNGAGMFLVSLYRFPHNVGISPAKFHTGKLVLDLGGQV